MKSKCIIVEGPQGCGKTHLVNYLRENIPASNLYRLSGQADKSEKGKEKSKKMYYALLNYMQEIEDSDINLVFDRIFFTEEVYCKLGYKDYSFDDVYKELLEMLGKLNYDVYYISLYLKDVNIYEIRLKREHHNYQDFSLDNSINQQNTYESLLHDIKKLKNTKVYEIAMDNFDEAYNEINKILEIVNKEVKF